MSAMPHAVSLINSVMETAREMNSGDCQSAILFNSVMETAREMNSGDCQSAILLVTNGLFLGTAKV